MPQIDERIAHRICLELADRFSAETTESGQAYGFKILQELGEHAGIHSGELDVFIAELRIELVGRRMKRVAAGA